MIYRIEEGQYFCGQSLGVLAMEGRMPYPPGTPGNAWTFKFPVSYRLVRGTTLERLVYEPDPKLYESFLDAGRELVKEGVRAIAGNCGFMILYQEQLARDLAVPVFMSSLLQLPFIGRIIRPDEKIAIVTASKRSLTDRHMAVALNGAKVTCVVGDMEGQPNFNKAILQECGSLDFEAVEREAVSVARELVEQNPDVGAILLECCDLPPYAAAVQAATGLPVFDVTTMINYAVGALLRTPFSGFH